MQVLEPRLIDDVRAESRGFGELQDALLLPFVIGPRGQTEIARAQVVESDVKILVTDDERVALVDGIVEAWCDAGTHLRCPERLVDGHRPEIAIERGGEDERVFVD